MSRLRARLRQHLAHRRLARALAEQRRCCGGQCTTSSNALLIPRQRSWS